MLEDAWGVFHGFAYNIEAGPPDEGRGPSTKDEGRGPSTEGQALSFTVLLLPGADALFITPPQISSDGTLHFSLAADASGVPPISFKHTLSLFLPFSLSLSLSLSLFRGGPLRHCANSLSL